MKIEINKECFSQYENSKIGKNVLITPCVSEDYFLFRIPLYKDQAILGFPKFGVIGVGFAQEEDWNTNLPSSCDALEIYNHIKKNKKYKQIKKLDCIKAIEMIQT